MYSFAMRKTSRCVSREVLIITFAETQREETHLRFPLQSAVGFEIYQVSRDDRFAAQIDFVTSLWSAAR